MSNLQNILQSTFGLNDVVITDIQPYRAMPIGGQPDAPVQARGSLGNPVFSDLLFDGGRYVGTDGITYTVPEMYFETVIVTLTQTKNIVKTTIQGSDNGTVKEYIGMGDWNVQVQGILTGSNGIYPKDDIDNLYKLVKAPIAIPVTGWYLQQFDINHLVIDDITLAQEAGSYSQQKITMKCWSDNTLNAFIS